MDSRLLFITLLLSFTRGEEGVSETCLDQLKAMQMKMAQFDETLRSYNRRFADQDDKIRQQNVIIEELKKQLQTVKDRPKIAYEDKTEVRTSINENWGHNASIPSRNQLPHNNMTAKQLFEDNLAKESKRSSPQKNQRKRLLAKTPTNPPVTTTGTRNVAFQAEVSHSLQGLGKGHHIIFDVEKINTGNGYNPFSGTFTAPVSGTYFFSWTISFKLGDIALGIYVNGDIRSAVNAFQSGAITNSDILVTEVNQGDVVTVRTDPDYQPSGQIYINVHNKAKFNGFLIF